MIRQTQHRVGRRLVYHGDPLIPTHLDLPACTVCAKCCYMVVEINPGDLQVPEELIVEHSGVRCMDQRGDGACVALDRLTRHCTIYEKRPQVCRDFTRGESLCRRQVLTRN